MTFKIALASGGLGLLVLLATVAYAILERNPTHGTGVVGGMTVVLSVLLTAFAGTCCFLDRARRRSPSTLADAACVLVFFLMCFLLLGVAWSVTILLEEIWIARR